MLSICDKLWFYRKLQAATNLASLTQKLAKTLLGRANCLLVLALYLENDMKVVFIFVLMHFNIVLLV